MKEHVKAQFINELTDLARQYGHCQQLRERIATCVKKYMDEEAWPVVEEEKRGFMKLAMNKNVVPDEHGFYFLKVSDGPIDEEVKNKIFTECVKHDGFKCEYGHPDIESWSVRERLERIQCVDPLNVIGVIDSLSYADDGLCALFRTIKGDEALFNQLNEKGFKVSMRSIASFAPNGKRFLRDVITFDLVAE